MSSPKTTSPKEASASSSTGHDPALERAAPGSAIASPGSPPPSDGRVSGDGSLHLQNAHYGDNDVGAQEAGAGRQGAAESSGASVASTGEVEVNSGVQQRGAENGAEARAAPSSGEGASDGTANATDGPRTNSRSAATDGAAAPGAQTSSGHAQVADLSPQSSNMASGLAADGNSPPTDIALSNTLIDENAAGAVVGVLTTVDPDAGDQFSYSVSDDRFEVVDGHLKLKDGISLDHESEPFVTISVTSTDSAGHSITESFTITIANVNEGPSDIALSNATIAENADGAVVGTLSTVDPDAGDSHTYSVSDDRFEVVGDQLKLKAGVALDHEAEASVTVQVTTTDAGGLTRTESFTITVANVNEAPNDIALSNASVAENAAGAAVGTLSTVDPDAGDSHAYSVSDDRFEVVGGQLKLKDGVSLDHEAEPSVTVQVTSIDAGGLSISEDFTITVENVNERPTDIALSNATVAENAAGAVVGTLSTADPDAGDNHTYSVSDSRFEVVAGELKLKDGVSLDHEAEPSVTVQVTSTDAGGLSISEDFTITVGDVNEGPTGIVLSSATVAENAAGAVIGTLSTADPDAGDSHTYTVSDSRFEVVGGQLKLKAGVALDYEAASSVSLSVTATDAGGLSTTQDFTIAVSDVVELNVINGTPGNDTLNGTAGVDLINGLAGNDTINAGAGNDIVVAGAGNDTVDGQDGSDTYRVGAGHGFDRYSDTGATGTDTVVATGNNVAIGVQSGFGPASGIEEISAGGFSGVSVAGGTGNDTLNFSGTTLTGITKIDGGAGNDTITGSAAGDTIVGGAGNDTLDGGGGGDTYQVGAGAGFDRFNDTGGSGTDTVVATANNVAIGVQSGFGPASGIEQISAGGYSGVSIAGGTGNDTLDFSNTTLTGITKIDGGAGNDTITGSAAGDTIVGGTGNDALRGGEGGDTYQVGAGHGFDSFADTGTTGTDTVVATANNVAIGVQSGFGPASGIEAISAGGFSGVSVVGGTGNDTLDFSNTTLTGITKVDGGAGNDTITGSGAADTIVGGAGNDTLRGGDGGDTYQVGTGHGFDSFADTGTTGTDTVVATANNVAIGVQSGFGPASGIEEISAGGLAGVSIAGGGGSDTLNFSNTVLTGITKIDGGAGNDTVTGSAAADTIVGGAGNDTLDGGGGGDTYQVGVGHGFDRFNDTGAAGTDTVVATADNVVIGLQSGFAPASGIEEISAGGFAGVSIAGGGGGDTLNFSNTVLTGITKIDGGAGNDTITGSAGADTVVGGAGNDTLAGGDGGDTYQVGAGHGFDRFNDTGATGADTIVATADNVAIGLQSGFGPASGIEEISAGGFSAVSIAAGTGNDNLNFSNTTLTGITKIDGGSGNDTITGSAAGDTIIGGSGNDNLMGGGGDDTIEGGAGGDTLSGGSGLDALSYETSNAGVTVNLGANAVSGGHAQGDAISGFENVTGSSFDDTFYGNGNGNANVINAGAGDDTFHVAVGGGQDTVFGDVGSDHLHIDTGGGSGGWLEAVAYGSTPILAAGDWLLELDIGEAYIVHGAGGDFDFGASLSGTLTAQDGSETTFSSIEGVHW